MLPVVFQLLELLENAERSKLESAPVGFPHRFSSRAPTLRTHTGRGSFPGGPSSMELLTHPRRRRHGVRCPSALSNAFSAGMEDILISTERTPDISRRSHDKSSIPRGRLQKPFDTRKRLRPWEIYGACRDSRGVYRHVKRSWADKQARVELAQSPWTKKGS